MPTVTVVIVSLKEPCDTALRMGLPGNLVKRPNKVAGLLNDITWTDIARIQRFASGESFVLAMIEADAVLAKPPAQVDFFVINQGREVEQSNLKIFDEATRFKDAIEGGLQSFRKLLMLDAEGGELFVRDNDAAHHGNAGGNRGEIRFQTGQLFAAIHGFDQKRFQLFAGTLRFGEGKDSRFGLGGLALIPLVVFVRHADSVLAVGLAGRVSVSGALRRR